MTDAHLAFTLALHRALAPDPNHGACWSPYSLASALGLVAAGARGRTRDELVALLGDVPAVGRLVNAASTLDPPRHGAQEPVLAVLNTLWADDMIPIRDSFAEELSGWLDGTVRTAPFRAEPEKTRQLINRDVAETTRDLIPELIPKGAIEPRTVGALVNALYLKCGWQHPFAEDATRPRPFHTPAGTVTVPTMELSETLGYARIDGWEVVGLRAAGGVHAVILLPDKALAEAERTLDAPGLARLLDAPQLRKVRLRLPKVKVSLQVELKDTLESLGVRTMFTDQADLSPISPAQLYVQKVFHESVLKLDEQGLEGAAATAVMIGLLSLTLEDPVEVDVNRPFLLLVRHAATGAIYFLARVVTPGS